MGHITFAAFDLLQVQIDSPYSGLRDGYCNDFGEIPEKYWFVKDNQITNLCLKDAKKLLIELYQAAYLFDHERQAVQKALLNGIEAGNEHCANRDTPSEIAEAYGIDLDGKVREITDPDELTPMKDTRPFEEQRDFFILNGILDRLYFDHKVWTNLGVVAQLVKKYFGVSLVYPSHLEKVINERLQKFQGNK